MCVVNKQFELLEFVFDSVYIDLQHDEISLTFTAGSVSLCCVCRHVVCLRGCCGTQCGCGGCCECDPCVVYVVIFGLSVRSSWYPMWM